MVAYTLDGVARREAGGMDREQAERFFNKWLKTSTKRKTDSMGWPRAYKEDTINMIIEASQGERR